MFIPKAADYESAVPRSKLRCGNCLIGQYGAQKHFQKQGNGDGREDPNAREQTFRSSTPAPARQSTRTDLQSSAGAASVLIAVDTNVLLDQAVGDADVIDALSVIRKLACGQIPCSSDRLGRIRGAGGKWQQGRAQSGGLCHRLDARLGLRAGQFDPCRPRHR